MLWPLEALKSRSLGVPPVLDAILGPVRWNGMGWDRGCGVLLGFSAWDGMAFLGRTAACNIERDSFRGPLMAESYLESW